MDIKRNLSSETVERAYPVAPSCVEPSTTVREVLSLLKDRRVGSVLVCREGRLSGIFTERDALRLMARGAQFDVAIEEVMTPRPVAVLQGSSMGEAIRKMSQGGYRHLPIVDTEQRPVGVIKVAGIIHYLVEFFPKAIYNQPPMTPTGSQSREGA